VLGLAEYMLDTMVIIVESWPNYTPQSDRAILTLTPSN